MKCKFVTSWNHLKPSMGDLGLDPEAVELRFPNLMICNFQSHSRHKVKRLYPFLNSRILNKFYRTGKVVISKEKIGCHKWYQYVTDPITFNFEIQKLVIVMLDPYFDTILYRYSAWHYNYRMCYRSNQLFECMRTSSDSNGGLLRASTSWNGRLHEGQ